MLFVFPMWSQIRQTQNVVTRGACKSSCNGVGTVAKSLTLRLDPPHAPSWQHNMAVLPVELVGTSRRLEDSPDIGVLRQADKIVVQLA